MVPSGLLIAKRIRVASSLRLRRKHEEIEVIRSLSACIAGLVLSGCVVSGGAGPEPGASDEAMTLGNVQRRIAIGMSSADVAEQIGSPNIVTTDADRNEVWVYDRFATEAHYEDTAVGLGLLIGGISGDAGGVGGIGAHRASGSRTRTQRTLTVVVKFDDAHRVRDLAYHASRF